MINLMIGILLLIGILWAAKKFYFPTEMADHPEKYPITISKKVTQRGLTTTLEQIQRWRNEGKISREEYDHLTDICLAEIKQLSKDDPDQFNS